MTRNPLISAEELLALVAGDAPNLRIVDVRWYLGRPGDGPAAYAAGHLPGAIHLDLDDDLADPDGYGAPGRHPLPAPNVFADELEAAGIGDGDLVVGYDDVGGWVAARLWWMLDVLGHERVAVLDGGVDAWIAAGGELTTVEPSWPPTELHLAGHWSRVIDRAELRSKLGEIILLDARIAPRYRGEREPIDPVAGHIPTARNVPVARNLVNGRFRPPEELAARYRALGADGSGGPVVTSCGSGTSALHIAIAMRRAGLPDPILYVGSYSQWSRSDEPVVSGPEPGAPPPPR